MARQALPVAAGTVLWMVKCLLVVASLALGGAALFGSTALAEALAASGLKPWCRHLIGSLEIAGALALPSATLMAPAAVLLGMIALAIAVTGRFAIGGSALELGVAGLAAAIVWADRARRRALREISSGLPDASLQSTPNRKRPSA